jgi:hypothetical protein
MIEVKLKEKSYSLPTSWDEITLGKFKRIMLVDNKQEEIEYKLEILSEILECTIEELEEVQLSSLNSLYNQVELLLKDEPKTKFESIFKINGKEYYFENDFEKSTTTGMFIDLQNLMKGGFWENAEQILAIWIRPVKEKKYDYSKFKGWKKEKYPLKYISLEKYNYQQRIESAKDILQMPMSLIFPCSVFFWTFSGELVKNILPSLEQVKKMKMSQMKK